MDARRAQPNERFRIWRPPSKERISESRFYQRVSVSNNVDMDRFCPDYSHVTLSGCELAPSYNQDRNESRQTPVHIMQTCGRNILVRSPASGQGLLMPNGRTPQSYQGSPASGQGLLMPNGRTPQSYQGGIDSGKLIHLTGVTLESSVSKNMPGYSKPKKTPGFYTKTSRLKHKTSSSHTYSAGPSKKSNVKRQTGKKDLKMAMRKVGEKRRDQTKEKPTFSVVETHAADTARLRALLVQNGWTCKQWKTTQTQDWNSTNTQLLLLSRENTGLLGSLNENITANFFQRVSTPVSDWFMHEAVCPRTFTLTSDTDKTVLYEFINEFFKSTCYKVVRFVQKNLVKVLSGEAGQIPGWILVYAIDHCAGMPISCEKYFLTRSPGEHRNHDKKIRDERQRLICKQNEFLQFAHDLLYKGGCFEEMSVERNFLDGTAKRLKALLKSMKESGTSGSREVRSNVWIVKADKSTGHGIRTFRKLNNILNYVDTNEYACDYYTVQRFISNRFLIRGKRFKIHHFVLLTALQPVTIEQLQFDIIINMSEYECPYEYEEDEKRWTCDRFVQYLSSAKKDKCWEEQIRPAMRTATDLTVRHNVDGLVPSNTAFEIVRTTFVLDRNLHPWMINVVSNPNDKYLCDNAMLILYKCILDRIPSDKPG